MTAKTLDGDLRASAARHAARTAVVVRRPAAVLCRARPQRRPASPRGCQQLGVQRGDRVAVVLRNSVEAAIAIYGILRAGAAFVPLNPTAKAEKLGYLLAHSEAVAAICDAEIAPRLHEARDHAPGLRHRSCVGDAW